jgi:hypothetical protein
LKLVGDILRQGDLGDAIVAELFQLYARYYAPTSLAVFSRDLASKSYSIVVRDPQGRIRGFSTVARFSMMSVAGEIDVLFSGDTVVERSFWGEQTLPFRWIEEAGRIKAERQGVPLYWLLITKGHRTFRYLPGFAKDYFPGAAPSLRDQARLGTPHVQAFLAQNPNHAQGEELVCLCELDAENLRPRARAQFLKGMG